MRLPALVFLTGALAVAGCDSRSVATAPEAPSLGSPSLVLAGQGVTARASGQGILESGSFRTFAFNAVQKKDGSVEGHTTLQNHTAGIRIHTRVECISVQGNRAVLTGHITESTIPGYPGRFTLVVVEDNGEGGNVVDRMSFQYIYPAGAGGFSCDAVLAADVPAVPVTKGNIQVAP